MAEKHNATCSICGRPYYKCISCKDTMALNPWKAFCDTAEHYKVHQIIRGFNSGVYTKDEALNKLKNVDISDKDSFRENIKVIVEDILKEDNHIEEIVFVEAAVEETVLTEESVEEKPTYSRKRNYKMDNEVSEAEESDFLSV